MLRSLQPLLLASVFLFGGLGLGTHRARAQPARLTVALDAAPQTLDPRYASTPVALHLTELLYESLVTQGDSLQFLPQLAERWEQISDTEYLVTLKSGVWFHDGTLLTAADVKTAFDLLLDPRTRSRFQHSASKLESCEIEDDLTVRFLLHEGLPESVFLAALQAPIFKLQIIPGWDSGIPVGSGPFMLTNRSSEEIVLQRHWGYHAGTPNVEEVRFQIILEAKTRVRKLLNGSIDLASNVIPVTELAKFRTPEAQNDFSLLERTAPSYRYFAFNTEHPILQEVQVRQAIAHAINRKELVALLMKNHARLATGIFPPEHAFHTSIRNPLHSPESAAQLLDEIGFPLEESRRLRIRLATTNDKEQIRLARLVADQLARVGIEVTVTPQSQGKFWQALKSGDFDLAVVQERIHGDADFLHTLFHSHQTPEKGGRNFTRYRNLELDSLLESGRHEQNPAQRMAVYQQVQRLLLEELPHLPLWHENNLAFVSKRVSGYRFHPTGNFHAFRTLRVN